MLSDLFEAFYKKYERPQVDELTVAFSGIDPDLKFDPFRVNHERLGNLLGGDESEHYHLTEDQLLKLIYLMEKKYPPEIYPDQSIPSTADKAIDPYKVLGDNTEKTV